MYSNSYYSIVINYDQPVPLAHMLVKVNVEPSGMVESVLNKQLKVLVYINTRLYSYSDLLE